jgi:hypothetical protein
MKNRQQLPPPARKSPTSQDQQPLVGSDELIATGAPETLFEKYIRG